MPRTLRPSTIVPPGFRVEDIQDGAITMITVRHTSPTSQCPNCAVIAERVHSRYLRRLADLPLAGATSSSRRYRAAVPMRCCFLPPSDFHGTVQSRCRGAVGSPYRAA